MFSRKDEAGKEELLKFAFELTRKFIEKINEEGTRLDVPPEDIIEIINFSVDALATARDFGVEQMRKRLRKMGKSLDGDGGSFTRGEEEEPPTRSKYNHT